MVFIHPLPPVARQAAQAESDELCRVTGIMAALSNGNKTKNAKLAEFLASFKEERQTLNQLLESERNRVVELELKVQSLQKKHALMEQMTKRLYDGFVKHLKAIDADQIVGISLEQRVEALLLASHVANNFDDNPDLTSQKSEAFYQAIDDNFKKEI